LLECGSMNGLLKLLAWAKPRVSVKLNAYGMCRSVLFILMCLLLSSCSQKEFRTKAVYEGTKSGFTLEVIGWGEYSKGYDVAFFGEFDAVFIPTSGQGSRVEFQARFPDKNDINSYQLTVKTNGDVQQYQGVYLEDILEDVLYTNFETYDFDEGRESIFAIDAVRQGPSVTIKEGGAKYLEVKEVILNYKGQ
jgi:hypothetical protein